MYVTKITGTVTLYWTSKGTEGFSANGYHKNGTALTTSPICTTSATKHPSSLAFEVRFRTVVLM